MDKHLTEVSQEKLIEAVRQTRTVFCSSTNSKRGKLSLTYDCRGNYFVTCPKLGINEVFSIPQNAIYRYRSIYLEN